MALQRAWLQWQELKEHLAWCDERISAHLKANDQVRQAEQLMGIGPVTDSAVVAAVGDFGQFKNGAQFGAWLGLTPRQNSSGGKNQVGRHHQARGHSFTHAADSGSQVGGDDGPHA